MPRPPGFYSAEADGLGQLLRKSRRAKGLTQQAVAKKLRISQSFYSKIERGKIPMYIVEELAVVLGIEEPMLRRAVEKRHDQRKATISADELRELAEIAEKNGPLRLSRIPSLLTSIRFDNTRAS